MVDEDLIEVGYVARTHGVRGAVIVRLHWVESEALFNHDAVEVRLSDGAVMPLELVEVREHPRGFLVHFGAIVTKEQADELRGATLWVPREELEPGQYYLADLVGAEVIAPDGTVGVVESIGNYPTMDVLVVRTPEGVRVEQPLLDQWVERVLVDERKVLLLSREGILE